VKQNTVFNLCQHFEILYSRNSNKHITIDVYITILIITKFPFKFYMIHLPFNNILIQYKNNVLLLSLQ